MRCKWIYEIADNKKMPFSRFNTSTRGKYNKMSAILTVFDGLRFEFISGKIYETSDDIIYNARNQFRTYQRAYLPK